MYQNLGMIYQIEYNYTKTKTNCYDIAEKKYAKIV